MIVKSKPWCRAICAVQDRNCETREIEFRGRSRRAPELRILAGKRGMTAIEMNGPRLHAYIFDLRRGRGLCIILKEGPYRGDFPAHHGRYFLLSRAARKRGVGFAA